MLSLFENCVDRINFDKRVHRIQCELFFFFRVFFFSLFPRSNDIQCHIFPEIDNNTQFGSITVWCDCRRSYTFNGCTRTLFSHSPGQQDWTQSVLFLFFFPAKSCSWFQPIQYISMKFVHFSPRLWFVLLFLP